MYTKDKVFYSGEIIHPYTRVVSPQGNCLEITLKLRIKDSKGADFVSAPIKLEKEQLRRMLRSSASEKEVIEELTTVQYEAFCASNEVKEDERVDAGGSEEQDSAGAEGEGPEDDSAGQPGEESGEEPQPETEAEGVVSSDSAQDAQ